MSYNYHLDSSCGNGENWPSVFFIGLFNFLIIKVTHLVYTQRKTMWTCLHQTVKPFFSREWDGEMRIFTLNFISLMYCLNFLKPPSITVKMRIHTHCR